LHARLLLDLRREAGRLALGRGCSRLRQLPLDRLGVGRVRMSRLGRLLQAGLAVADATDWTRVQGLAVAAVWERVLAMLMYLTSARDGDVLVLSGQRRTVQPDRGGFDGGMRAA
jgi:hypothetical protein